MKIGQTTSKKAIDSNPCSSKHSKFTEQDHADASKLHRSLATEKYKKSTFAYKQNDPIGSSLYYKEYYIHNHKADVHLALKKLVSATNSFKKK